VLVSLHVCLAIEWSIVLEVVGVFGICGFEKVLGLTTGQSETHKVEEVKDDWADVGSFGTRES
jgi:hypothetical protein